MDLRSLFIFVAGLIARLSFLARHANRPDIFVLAPVLIALQDGRISRRNAEAAVAPFAAHLGDFLGHLARNRETRIRPPGSSIRLPRGCRLGLLHFSPLLQIARILGQLPVDVYEELPSTREAIMAYLERTCGWASDVDEAVKRRFGHTLGDYAGYLFSRRQKDPVLYVLLMAREFPLAERYLADQASSLNEQWILRAARLAEVQRLAEMMSFCRGRKRIMSSRVRKALAAMVYRERPRQRRNALWEYRDCLSTVRRLMASIEAIRVIFLGDAASSSLIDTDQGAIIWRDVPLELRRTAASRCELFSRYRARHSGARRDLAIDMYYGIPLEQLSLAAIFELTHNVADSVGADDCALIAACMCHELIGRGPTFHRSSRRAPMIEEIYLRRYGKRGCGGRFDFRLQFNPERDVPLYWMLSAASIGASTAQCRSSVRGLVDVAAVILNRALASSFGAINPRLAARVMAYLASSLTPPTMDPLFASLIDRCMTERVIPANSRTSPWTRGGARPGLVQIVRRTFRDVRAHFARFEDLGERRNHPDADKCPPPVHRPLSVQPTVPRLTHRLPDFRTGRR